MLAQILFIITLFFSLNIHAQSIGIVGDTHGEVSAALKAIKDLKDSGAQNLILTGDLVGFSPDNELYRKFKAGEIPQEQVLSVKKILQEQAHEQLRKLYEGIRQIGFQPHQIFSVPGNWEKAWAPKAMEIMDEHSRLVATSYDGKGIVNIAGKKVMISHYPQFPVSSKFIPANALEEDVMLMSKMSPLGYPSEKVDLVVFGHTHEPFSYMDPKAKSLVVNSGSLSVDRMEDSHRSYAKVNLDTSVVEIRNAQGKTVRTESYKPTTSSPSVEKAQTPNSSQADSGCATEMAEALMKGVR